MPTFEEPKVGGKHFENNRRKRSEVKGKLRLPKAVLRQTLPYAMVATWNLLRSNISRNISLVNYTSYELYPTKI